MNDDGGRRRLCKLHDAFEAQQVGTVQRAQQVEENVQRGGWHRGFAGEGERADALVVAVSRLGGAAGAVIPVGISPRPRPPPSPSVPSPAGRQPPRAPAPPLFPPPRPPPA